MLDWVEYRKEILGRIKEMSHLSPGTNMGYQTLTVAGEESGHLNARTRELISLAVATTLRCDGSITVHTKAALAHGATAEEIAEALGVAVAVNAGATMVFSGRVLDAVAAHKAAL